MFFRMVLQVQVESPISNRVERRLWRLLVLTSPRLPRRACDARSKPTVCRGSGLRWRRAASCPGAARVCGSALTLETSTAGLDQARVGETESIPATRPSADGEWPDLERIV